MATPQNKRRYNNPPLTFKRKPPANSPVVKSLFGKGLPLNMSGSTSTTTNPVNNPNPVINQRDWSSNLFKPLDMLAIPSYPRQMPPKYEKWLPKFFGIDAIGAEEHMSSF